jgi:hypothetical protein
MLKIVVQPLHHLLKVVLVLLEIVADFNHLVILFLLGSKHLLQGCNLSLQTIALGDVNAKSFVEVIRESILTLIFSISMLAWILSPKTAPYLMALVAIPRMILRLPIGIPHLDHLPEEPINMRKTSLKMKAL